MAYNTIPHARIGSHNHCITLNRPARLNAITPDLRLEVIDACRELAAASPIGNKVAEMSWRFAETLDLEAANEVAASTAPVAGRTEDCRESVRAFLEKRRPVFRGR